MSTSIPISTLEKFTTFGDLLRFLRRRAGITQMELAIATGYSDAQISRLEQNLRLPDIPTIEARFIAALGLEEESRVVERLLELAANVRREDAPGLGLCPYKGLNYFDESDADLFVGREALTTRLTERVLALTLGGLTNETRFLAIIGASGSGKSSLVRAGLVPSLRWNKKSAEWHIHIFTPTAHPLERLAASLTGESNSVAATSALMDDLARDPRSLQIFVKRKLQAERGVSLLLVIDQFEELFTLCHSEPERVSFIENLLTAASETEGPVIVILTLRADFYAHCANYVQLREALARNQEYIGAMNDAELRRAIEEPAQRGRWEFEPGLVDLLLHDIGHEPGALPLLSHALLETWQRRRNRTMTLSGYASSGGVRGAIAETAETVFTDQFTHEQQVIARRIFLRLTELSDETSVADTRRRATFDELILKPEEASITHDVLKKLADARLVTTSEDSAEVAHEALIREWHTLRGWLEDNREGLRLHRQLTEAAQEWQRMDCEPDLLYRGARLAQIREWCQLHREELNPLEHEFLNTSIEQSEHEAGEREAQRQRELEAAKKLAETEQRRAEEQTHSTKTLRTRNRVITTVGAIALVLALLAGTFGFQSNQENKLAASRELALAANSNLHVDPERSILLALEALSQAETSEAEGALHSAVQASRVELRLNYQAKNIWSIAYSPDGTRLATIGGEVNGDNQVKIWDSTSGKELFSFSPPLPGQLQFSPEGMRLAITYKDENTVGIFDAITGNVLLTISVPENPIYVFRFSHDGTRLATGHGTGTVKIWDLATGKEILTLDVHQDAVGQVEFSPDDMRLLASNFDLPTSKVWTKVWDLTTGKEVFTLSGGAARHTPDGTRIATNNSDQLILWDAITGQQLYISSDIQKDSNVDWVFNIDGTSLIQGYFDGTIGIWDVSSAEKLLTFPAHVGFINVIAVHPDGIHIATASTDGTVKVFNISPQGNREWLTLVGLEGISPGFPYGKHAKALAYSPDGSRLATNGLDNTAIIWDAETGNKIISLRGHTDAVLDIAFNPDGSRLATCSRDLTVKIWDANSGKVLLTMSQPRHGDGIIGDVFSGIMAIGYSPDGKMLATAGADGTAILWDASTGQALMTLDNQGIGIPNLTFSPDGTQLATAGDVTEDAITFRSINRVWDTATGKELFHVDTSEEVERVFGLAYSPNGKILATGDFRGTVRFWDAQTGEALFSLPQQTAFINQLAFSPDNSRLAAVGGDETTRLWDVATGKELLTLHGHTGSVMSVVFSPDGTRLATSGYDGTARIYLLNIDELIALAKSRVTRSLTTEECQKYLHVEVCPAEP